jgi:hypothetical protein
MDRCDSFLMTNALHDLVVRWMAGSCRGRAFGVWLASRVALPQLRRMALEAVSWSPLQGPLAEATVALVTTTVV